MPARGRPEDEPRPQAAGEDGPASPPVFPGHPTGFDGELIELLRMLGHDGAAMPTQVQLGTW